MSYTNAQIVTAALSGKRAATPTGSMTTEPGTGWGTGRMPRAHARLLGDRRQHVTQVIYSYATPIAWHDDEYGWVIPDVSYSITTSTKHQTHLYRLRGRTISLPYDATPEDALRVLSGEMVFTSTGYGANRRFTGTLPGPNFVLV